MMLIRESVLGFLGLCSGFAVASGIFAFITMLGIVPRLAARTHTARRISWYERAILIGGTLGNIWFLFEIPLPLSVVFLCLVGLFDGIFVGCLAMALAEMLKALPIMVNRLQLKEGFPLIVSAIALGKLTGALFQFLYQ